MLQLAVHYKKTNITIMNYKTEILQKLYKATTIQSYTLQPQNKIQNNELHWEAWSKNKGGGTFLEK